MTTKWTIRKYPIRDNGEPDDFPWFLFRPGVIPPKTNGGAFWRCVALFATFSEALAWVNYKTAEEYRKTHTVEVVLPKVEKNKCINPDMSPAMFVAKTTGNYGVFLGHRHMLAVTAEELKPLAEYLLALHYEKENK